MGQEIDQPPTLEDLDNRLATVDELPPDLQALLIESNEQMIRSLSDEVKRACVEAGLQLDRNKGPIFTLTELRTIGRLSEEYYDRERDRAAEEAQADERAGGWND